MDMAVGRLMDRVIGSLFRGVGSETGSREGGGGNVVLSPDSVFTSSEAPFLPLSDSAENSVCCPFSRRSHFFSVISSLKFPATDIIDHPTTW